MLAIKPTYKLFRVHTSNTNHFGNIEKDKVDIYIDLQSMGTGAREPQFLVKYLLLVTSSAKELNK